MTDIQVSWLDQLQAKGHRITQPLRVIVGIMVSTSQAVSAVQVFDLGRQEFPRLGLVTVYRALDKLEQLGLVQRVHQPDGCHRFVRSAPGHQHMLLCTQCGQVKYFSGDDLSLLFGDLSAQTGFEIEEHWLQLFGLCAVCKT